MIYLKHIEGSKRGQAESFDLERIRIGRHPDNELKFDPDADREVSGHHAEILCQGEQITIRDLQSRNGTLVNGRRINQPTTLRDGDTIQFAATGPKIVFSLGEAAPGTGTIVADRDQIKVGRSSVEEPEVPTAPRAPAAPKTAASPSRWKHLAILAVLLLLSIGVLVLAAWWSWTAFYVVLGILLLAAGVVVGILWWKRRHAMATETTARDPRLVARSAHQAARLEGETEGTLRELRGKWAQALDRLRRSKLSRQGDDPLSALPWLVVLGERGSGKTELIRAGNPPASVSTVRQAVSGTRTCDWWFFDGAVILDTPGRYTFPVDPKADGLEWTEFLSLLAEARPEAPLNGVLIAIAADALAARSDASLKDEATQLRRRFDELVRRTGVTPPLYIVVTKVDLLAGFGEFFADVPETHRGQAMGWVSDDITRQEPPTSALRRGLAAIGRQLERLRLAATDGREGATHRLGRGFLFPEELRALTSAVRTFAEALLRPNQYDETPWFRGVFFASARAGGAPASCLARALGLADIRYTAPGPTGPNFSRDLFSSIFPQDRELVRHSPVARTHGAPRRRTALLGAGALILCVLLTVSFVRNSRILARVNVSLCLPPVGAAVASPFSGRLQRLDQCRELIVDMAPRGFWDRLTTDFLLRQTKRIELPLAQRYIEMFRREIDEPLDVALDRALVPGPGAPVVVSAVLQRIALTGKCRADGRCPREDSVAWPNYHVLLSVAEPGSLDSDGTSALLRRTHSAYLNWLGDPRLLDEMRARDLARVGRWLSGNGLRAEWILASTSRQFAPIRSRDFWGWDGPLQVDAPFTKRAWADGIQPLLVGLRGIAPDAVEVQDRLSRFESDYRLEALRQWGQFLLSFPREERVLGGRQGTRDLAVRCLEPNSPYRRVLDVAAAEMGAIVGSGRTPDELPLWAGTMLRFAAVRSKAQEARGLTKDQSDGAKGSYTDAERRALGALAAYEQALDQLRAELVGNEKAYQSAKRVFDEGEPTERSTHPLHRALWNIRVLRAAIGGDDRIVWGLVSRPVELVWRGILEEAAQYLQGQWEVLIPGLVGLTPGLQAAKILEFANGPAATLLERSGDRYVIKRFLGEGAPLSPAFLQFISRIRWIPPDRLERIDPPRLIVAPT